MATIESRVDTHSEVTSIRVLLPTILASIVLLTSSSAINSGKESKSSAAVALSAVVEGVAGMVVEVCVVVSLPAEVELDADGAESTAGLMDV